MPKNTNKTKETGTNFDLTADYLIEIQLIAKILLKQRSLNQIRHCFTVHNRISHQFLEQIILKYLNDFQNRNFSIL